MEYSDLHVEFLSNKKDKYDNDFAYFKVIDNDLKKIYDLHVDKSVPLWRTADKNDLILKVKTKNIPKYELNKMTKYIINVSFVPFSVGKSTGYYAIIRDIKSN